MLWGLERLIESRAPAMTIVGSVTSCAEAISKIKEVQPSIILLEIALGNEDVIAEIPKMLAASSAQILVLTGVADKKAHDRAVLAGARGVVEKRASPDTLLSAITKVHDGEIWLDRLAMGRVFVELSRESAAQEADPDRQKILQLTKKERVIVAAIAGHPGASAKAIAEGLFISEHTLRNHLTAVYGKLDVRNRMELYAFAHRNGLAKPVPSKGHKASPHRGS